MKTSELHFQQLLMAIPLIVIVILAMIVFRSYFSYDFVLSKFIILMLMLLLLLFQVTILLLKWETAPIWHQLVLLSFKCNYSELQLLKVFLSETREFLLEWDEKCQCATGFVILLDTKSSYIESQRY